jgi:hypothetical protein
MTTWFNFNQSASPSVNAGDTGPTFGGVIRKLPTALTLVPVIDATASSLAFSQGIKTVCGEVADALSQTMADLKLGLHISRDLEFDRDANFSLGEDLTVDEFKSNLSRIAFEGGGDPLETQFDAVQTVLRTYPWNLIPTARRVIPLCSSSGSKPTRDGKDAAGLAAELNAMNIKVIVIAPNGVNLHELATATRGASLELTNNPSPADIQQVIKVLTRTLTQMAGSGGTTLAMPTNNKFGQHGTQVLGVQVP